jgi:hypothetical protein
MLFVRLLSWNEDQGANGGSLFQIQCPNQQKDFTQQFHKTRTILEEAQDNDAPMKMNVKSHGFNLVTAVIFRQI